MPGRIGGRCWSYGPGVDRLGAKMGDSKTSQANRGESTALQRRFASNRQVIAHECVHTAQHERLGGLRPFLELYIRQCVASGYLEAPLEQEARVRSAEMEELGSQNRNPPVMRECMTYEAFLALVKEGGDVSDLSLPLQALAVEKRGDWHGAHKLCQDDQEGDGAWVHAYLHRVEGDLSNAGYWYRRAGKPVQSGTTEAEWESITQTLLAKEGK